LRSYIFLTSLANLVKIVDSIPTLFLPAKDSPLSFKRILLYVVEDNNYSPIFKRLNLLIVIFSPNFAIVSVNKSLIEILGSFTKGCSIKHTSE